MWSTYTPSRRQMTLHSGMWPRRLGNLCPNRRFNPPLAHFLSLSRSFLFLISVVQSMSASFFLVSLAPKWLSLIYRSVIRSEWKRFAYNSSISQSDKAAWFGVSEDQPLWRWSQIVSSGSDLGLEDLSALALARRSACFSGVTFTSEQSFQIPAASSTAGSESLRIRNRNPTSFSQIRSLLAS